MPLAKQGAGLDRFDEIAARMPQLLQELESSQRLARNELKDVPAAGIYVFYEDDEPLYVGRTRRMKERLQEHGRPSSGRESATFAFLLAVEMAKEQEVDVEGRERAALEAQSDFDSIYAMAKARVRQMCVRVVEVNDPCEQTVFEVYAALALGTTEKFNHFETH